MTKASDNAYPSVLVTESTVPTSPAAGKQRLYIDSSTHKLKRVDSTGTTTTVESAGGSVATDTIWDAAGDLAVGSGADTAAKLSKGSTDGMELTMVSGVVAWALPAVAKLGEALLGSDTATFDFTSIPSTFRALELHCYIRGTKSATVDQCYLTLNNDGTSTWDWEYWEAENTTTTAAPTVAGTFYCANMTAGTGPANYFSAARILIPNYALTTGYKSVISNYSEIRDTTNGVGSGQHTGFWRNTAAVSRVTLTPGTGNFKTGSLVTLYGYK